MPLKKGYSQSVISRNIETLMGEGKNKEQAKAIAVALARKYKIPVPAKK